MTHNTYFASRVSLSAYFFVTGIIFASWASRIPDVKYSLHLSDGELGTALFAIPAGQLAMMAFSGFLVNRYGSRITAFVSLILYASILLLISQAASLPTLFCTLFLFGTMANLSNIACNTQASALEHLYGRQIMSSFHGLWSLGGLCGGIVGAAFANSGLPVLTHYFSVAVFAWVVLVLCYRPLLTADKPQQGGQRMHLSGIDKTIIMLGLMAFGGMFCEGIVFDWSSVYFATVVQPDANLIRMGYIAGMGSSTIVRFLADKLVTMSSSKTILRASGLLITVGVWLAAAMPGLATATLGFLLTGMGISSVVPICYSLAGRHPSLPASIAITVVSSVSFIGFMIGPPLIGIISEATNLRIALASASCFGLVIVALAAWINDSEKV